MIWGPIVNLVSEAHRRAAVDEQYAAMKLARVCDPRRLDALIAEAERRAEVIERVWLTAGLHPGDVTSPLVAGLVSVYNDATRGWL